MAMSFVPHKDEEFLGYLSDSRFLNMQPGPWISSVIGVLLSQTDNCPSIIYIELKKR
jgi:hypothetical protein